MMPSRISIAMPLVFGRCCTRPSRWLSVEVPRRGVVVQTGDDRGHSSTGRAPRLQRGGCRFDPGWLHSNLAVLSPSEVDDLQSRSFRIHSLDIHLEAGSTRFPSYRGPGSIRQNEQCTLRFELFDQTQEADPTRQPGTGAPGGLIPEGDYYRLTAVDLSVRRWTADRVLPQHGGRLGEPGVVCFGTIQHMQCPEQDNFPPPLRLFIPRSFDIRP